MAKGAKNKAGSVRTLKLIEGGKGKGTSKPRANAKPNTKKPATKKPAAKKNKNTNTPAPPPPPSTMDHILAVMDDTARKWFDILTEQLGLTGHYNEAFLNNQMLLAIRLAEVDLASTAIIKDGFYYKKLTEVGDAIHQLLIEKDADEETIAKMLEGHYLLKKNPAVNVRDISSRAAVALAGEVGLSQVSILKLGGMSDPDDNEFANLEKR